MTIARVNPGGWAGSAELTTAQINQTDSNFALYALDKTGDTIPSTSTITSSASLFSVANTAITGAGSCASASWQFGGVQPDGTPPTAGLAIQAGTSTIASGAWLRVIGARSTVQTSAGGRIQLADSDYLQFSAARTLSKVCEFDMLKIPTTTGWLLTIDGVKQQTLASGSLVLPLPPQWLHNGSTLTNATVYYTPSTTGTGGLPTLPATFASVVFTSRAVAVGAPLPTRTAVWNASDTAANATVYRNGRVRAISLAFGSPPVIDLATKNYALTITDETGAGSQGFSRFHSVKFTYTVPDGKFQ